MKKYTLYHVSEGTLFEASDTQPGQQFYLAAEVDARIAEHTKDWEDAAKERVQHLGRITELEKALREAIKWNWHTHAPPQSAEALVSNALMVSETN